MKASNGSASTIEIARRYAAAGLSVIPIRTDGSKSPTGSWTRWQSRIANDDELARLFSGHVGIAILNGAVSGNKELIDVDNPALVEPFENALTALAPGLLEKLAVIATLRNNHGGRQYHYRVSGPVKGNTKLAMSELRPQLNDDGTPEIDKRTGEQRLAPETEIETRGEGGYGLVPGCPGECHPSGLEYRHISGPSLESLTVISDAEHEILWRVGRSFNRQIEHREANTGTNGRVHNTGPSPGDDFNQRATWAEVLEPAGWEQSHQCGEITHWRRPGKSSGSSATTGVTSSAGTELFCVFSSNAHPFEGANGTRPCTSYSKFSAYAILNHGADYSVAAKALAALGYGSQPSGRPMPTECEVDDPMDEPDFDYGFGQQAKPKENGVPEPIIPVTAGALMDAYPKLKDPIIHGIARRGETVNIISASKIGKSWLAYALAFCIIIGRKFLNTFDCEPGNVLFIDNELHPATLAYRLWEVGNALGVHRSQFEESLHILPIRGKGLDLHAVGRALKTVPPKKYSVVIFDAWYRGLPAGVSENDNTAVMSLYNAIDGFAERMDAVWCNIHHSSKGSQSDKAVTDVGSGAGSQSRAADSHLILRRHEEEGAIVLEGAVRSFAPIDPLPLRWNFPLWLPDDSLDPELLKGKLSGREEKQNERDTKGMDALLVALNDGPKTIRVLRAKADLSKARCERLLDTLENKSKVKWTEITVRGNPCRQYELANPNEFQKGDFDDYRGDF